MIRTGEQTEGGGNPACMAEQSPGERNTRAKTKRLLLIMPKFHDYPEAIIDAAQELGYETDFVDDRPSERTLIKAILRLNPELLRIRRARYCEKVIQRTDTEDYDTVLVISGQSLCFDEDMMQRLRFCHPKARFVLYQWDSIANFPRIQRLYPWFDRIYTFDPEDVRNHPGVSFLPLFCIPALWELRKQGASGERKAGAAQAEQEDSKGSREGKERNRALRGWIKRWKRWRGGKQPGERFTAQRTDHWDLAYLGTAHPGRYERVCGIADALKEILPAQYLYHYLPSGLLYWYRRMTGTCFAHTAPWTFRCTKLQENERIYLFQHADIILDSPQNGQSGLTMRCIEAVCAGKKLITTNPGIKAYDFYRPENILVWEEMGEAEEGERRGNRTEDKEAKACTGKASEEGEPRARTGSRAAMVERARVFARTPMVPLPEEIYEKYSLSHWLQTVLKDPGKEPLAETQTKPQGGESEEGAEPRRGGEEKGRCKAGDDANGGGTAGAGV